MEQKTDPEIHSAVRSGYYWSLLNVTFSQAASLLIFLALSRVLSPAAFGVFALAAVIIDLISEQGRWASSDAIVQRRSYSPISLSSAFFSLQGLCILLAIILALSANQIAAAAGEPGVAHILVALGMTLLLMPAIAVMDALVLGRLNYRTQALRSMAGVSIGGVVGLSVAYSPAAEWALVAQRAASLGANLAVIYAFTRWRPQLMFDAAEARAFLRRAIQLWIATALASLHWRVTQASVGMRAGASDLGLLTVALRFDAALHGPVTGPIQSLWVPVLSALRSDRARSWQLFLRLSQLTALIALPAFVGLGLVGQDIVATVMDERYRGVGDILFVLGMQGFIIPIGFFSNLIFSGLDRSDLSLTLSAAYLCLTIPVVWMVAGHGAVPALSVSLLAMGTATALATVLQVRMLSGRLGVLLAAIAPAYAAGVVMLVVVLAAKHLLPLDVGLVRLICLATLGAVTYIGWLLLFHRQVAFDTFRYMRSARSPEQSQP